MSDRPTNIIVVTDCGSTTTKAILIEKKNGTYRLVARGEAPTTVEAPVENVTVGVQNALAELESASGEKLLADNKVRADITYLSTSSAGGGLQVLVAGVVDSLSTKSLERAALSAGAIVSHTLSYNDRQDEHQRIETIRQTRPDIVVLGGGTEHGAHQHVIQLAELIAAAQQRSRYGSVALPVVYAGNTACQDAIVDILATHYQLHLTDNVRPNLDVENLLPARDKIHDLFLSHVMAQAPGYTDLSGWVRQPIMPTPTAMLHMVEHIAESRGQNVLALDIGGATTDVFSVINGHSERSVSANLGMSYSVVNVLKQAGVENILRWLPVHLSPEEIRNRLMNKMIRPTTLPQTLDDLCLEQAVSREALRMALVHHIQMTQQTQDTEVGLNAFQQNVQKSPFDLLKLDLIVGSGGVISHAPRRAQAMAMLIDSILPEGVTELAVDSIFMLPHLGVLADLNPQAAMDVLENDCIVPLGTCLAPVGTPLFGSFKKKMPLFELQLDGRENVRRTFYQGDYELFGTDQLKDQNTIVVRPKRGIDVGAGKGQPLTKTIRAGAVGFVVDCRGRRPFEPHTTHDANSITHCKNAMREYPTTLSPMKSP